MWQKCEAAGHIATTVRKTSEVEVGDQLPSAFLVQGRTPAQPCGAGLGLCTSILETPSEITPEICYPCDSRF